MAAAAGEQKELLALMHKHLVQIGYEKAAKELLRQSGQKNFPSPSVPLEDIFIQWKKASFQAQKRKGDDIKTDIPAKIRIPDPESSSETSEEEDVASPVKTNLPVNNSSTAQAESSSEDEDSSSEEDVVSGKIVKPTVTGNQTATPLQLAAQKANSVPGKGVAIASVQAKERPNKANSNKPSPLLMAKAGQNKVLSGKPEAASPSQILKGQTTAPVSTAQKAAASESSSSSSESEEEMTSTAVKNPAPQQALKKTESSSEDSSEDSDSEEEESNAATVQTKPVVQRPPISAMPVKSCPTPVTSSKGSTVKVSQVFKGQTKTQVSIAQKVAVSETSSSSSESEEERTSTTIKAPIPKPALEKTESSSEDSSEDSDSEEEEESNAATVQVKPAVQSPQISATSVKSSPVTVASSKGSTVKASLAKTKAKSSEKTPQTSAASVKSALPNLLSSKATSTSAPLKQTSKPPVPSLVKPALLPPVKVAGSAESSESSESSSESEDEVLPVPVSQKRLQTTQPPSGVKSNLAAKPATPVKAPSSALKKEETESESSSSSDSEDETVPAAQNLPPPSATKSNAAAQLTHAKAASSASAPLKASQQSEDSSQDSSDESDTEEDTVFTQKSSPVAHKLLVTPIRALTAKTTGVSSGKACSVQSAGKTTANMGSLATASLQKSSESSETDSSDSSESEEDEKPAKQKVSPQKAATPSRKIVQVNTVIPNSNSNKCQGKNPSTTLGKVELSSAKSSQSQTSLTKSAEILKHKENATSSRSSVSKEEEDLDLSLPFATSTQILQPGIAQKQMTRETDSSSEESSDEELEPSQSLLAGYPGLSKPSVATVQKNIASKPSKQGSGKTATSTTGTPAFNALAKPSEKVGPADISSSDSSTSDSDAEEILAGPKAETGAVPFSAKGAVVAKMSKVTGAGKTGPAAITSKDISAKKASAKSERNGKAKGNGAIKLSLIPHTENGDKAVAQGPGAGAQGNIKTSPVVAVKTPKTAKSSKAGVKEKQKKKRKLAAGETGLKEPKRKKQKGQADSEEGGKKKKKKSKSKSKGKVPKEKDGKEKKSKSKKGKKKMPSSVTSDGSLLLKKKKKKKKKTSDLEGAV